MNNNIFIEGLPGCGKSTLLNRLALEWPEYHVYREGDLCRACLVQLSDQRRLGRDAGQILCISTGNPG